jgi:hypothetical protein
MAVRSRSSNRTFAAPCRAASARRADRLRRQVVADEPALRERPRQRDHRQPAAAPDVEHLDTRGQALRQSRHQRQDVIVQRRDDRLRALLGHHLVEPVVRLVPHAAAVRERFHQLVLGRPEDRDELRGDGHIVGRRGARQDGRVLGRQPVGVCRRVVLDDAPGDHRPEPLADVPLVELGLRRDLVRSRRAGEPGQRVEQAGAVAERGHQCEHGVVEHAGHHPGERVHLLGVECGRHVFPLPERDGGPRG